MILYLRTQKNETILDVEVWVKKDEYKYIELRSVVIIDVYSHFLLSLPEHQQSIIKDFEMLSELRGWLNEVYFAGEQNRADEYDIVVKEVSNILSNIASKYNLRFVVD